MGEQGSDFLPNVINCDVHPGAKIIKISYHSYTSKNYSLFITYYTFLEAISLVGLSSTTPYLTKHSSRVFLRQVLDITNFEIFSSSKRCVRF